MRRSKSITFVFDLQIFVIPLNPKNPNIHTQTLIGAGFAFAGAILFSAKAVFVKWAYRYDIDPVSLLTLRMLLSLPFFLVVAAWVRPALRQQRFRPKGWAGLIGLGLLGFYLASLLDFIGLQYISASLERLILFVYPTLVVLLSVVFLRKPIRRVHYLALLLTYAGIALAFADRLEVGGENKLLIGATWVFGAALAYALYLIGGEKLIPRMGALRFTANAMLIACAGVLSHQWVLHGSLNLLGWGREVYLLALCMALFSTVLPTFLFSKGIQYIGASNTAIVGSIGPVSTIVLAWYFLDEPISWWQLGGTALVVLGVSLISLQKGKG